MLDQIKAKPSRYPEIESTDVKHYKYAHDLNIALEECRERFGDFNWNGILLEAIEAEDIDLVEQGENWALCQINTFKGACALGQETDWCTTTRNFYPQYQNNLYWVINIDDGKRIQIHFESDAICDEQDQQILDIEEQIALMSNLATTLGKLIHSDLTNAVSNKQNGNFAKTIMSAQRHYEWEAEINSDLIQSIWSQTKPELNYLIASFFIAVRENKEWRTAIPVNDIDEIFAIPLWPKRDEAAEAIAAKPDWMENLPQKLRGKIQEICDESERGFGAGIGLDFSMGYEGEPDADVKLDIDEPEQEYKIETRASYLIKSANYEIEHGTYYDLYNIRKKIDAQFEEELRINHEPSMTF